MKRSLWITNLGFVPLSADLALLFLRLALGLTMLVLHGWQKVVEFPQLAGKFPDPLGLGSGLSLTLTLLTEVVASVMLVAGILSRFAAALLGITMSVAFFRVHQGNPGAPGAETALLYLYGYITILLAGPGRFAADAARGPWSMAVLAAVAGAVIGYPLSYIFQGAEYRMSTPLSGYLGGIRTVLREPATSTTAIAVWSLSILLLAVAGYLLGRSMNRRTVVVETAPPVDSPPAAL